MSVISQVLSCNFSQRRLNRKSLWKKHESLETSKKVTSHSRLNGSAGATLITITSVAAQISSWHMIWESRLTHITKLVKFFRNSLLSYRKFGDRGLFMSTWFLRHKESEPRSETAVNECFVDLIIYLKRNLKLLYLILQFYTIDFRMSYKNILFRVFFSLFKD